MNESKEGHVEQHDTLLSQKIISFNQLSKCLSQLVANAHFTLMKSKRLFPI